MYNSVAKHNIKKSIYLMASSLILTCWRTLVSAKTVKIRGASGCLEAGSAMLMTDFNFPKLIYRIGKNFGKIFPYECLNISLAKWTYPELDIDPEAIHQEYLDRFQHIDYDLDEHGVFAYPPIEIDGGLAGIPDRYQEKG